ncbi:MAG: FAD-dependent oxidoreductase [Pseudomonadota bacterium]
MTTSHPHIAVIGAGLIGLSTADALLRRGARVTVVERRSAPMGGASHANSGMIHPSQACSWDGPANDPELDTAVHALALRSRDLLAERMAELGLHDMQERAPGCFQLFDSDEDAEAARARLRVRGIAVETVASGTLPIDRPSLHFPDDRSGDARAYGMALYASIVARGARIHFGSPVELQLSGGRAALSTCNGPIEADAIVIAAGSETPSLLDAIGLAIPIRPVRGWAADYARPQGVNLPPAPVMDAMTRSALTVFSDRVRLSGTWGEETPDLLLRRWQELWPAFFRAVPEPDMTWSGLRPVCALGHPLIAETSVESVWVNAGHGHMGWTLCAGSGELLAKALLDGQGVQPFCMRVT